MTASPLPILPPTILPAAILTPESASRGMARRRVSVLAADVVYVKGLVEASEGLASVFAESGGELTMATPFGRESDLTALLDDLRNEIGARVGSFENDEEGSCR